jgi:heme A synthase
MKIVFRTFLFHILCIIIFAFLYSSIKESYIDKNKKKDTFLDFLLLSTTIQAGVGITNIYPINFYGKIVMILQQLIMLMTHIFTLYIFTL